MTCNCLSYNQPEWGGNIPEVILLAPAWSSKSSICIDACVADAITMLWQNGIVTLGSCCGHNRNGPSVIVDKDQDAQKVLELLKKFDGRNWRVLCWKLMDTENKEY